MDPGSTDALLVPRGRDAAGETAQERDAESGPAVTETPRAQVLYSRGVKRLASAAVAAAFTASLLSVTSTASAGSVFENCTSLNEKYPHGVGKKGAKDKTSGTPVTTFKRSTKLYNKAMKANSRLDGDKDGIACERA